jgi:membrane-associated protease RseP (regulator of RpoE activity)
LAALAASTIGVGVIFAQDTTTVTRNWLGIRLDQTEAGVVVERVLAGSPAADAGIEVGDVIISLDGATLATVGDLRDAIQAADEGATVALGVERDGESLDLDVTLETQEVGGRGGMFLADDPLAFAQMLLHADLTAVEGGYEVTNVLSLRNPFNVQVGDVVTSINGLDITALDATALRDSLVDADGTFSLSVTRGSESLTVEGEAGRGFGGRGGRGPGGMDGFGGRGGRGPGGPGGMGDGNVPPDTIQPDGNQGGGNV